MFGDKKGTIFSKLISWISRRYKAASKLCKEHPAQVRLIALSMIPVAISIAVMVYFIMQPPTMSVTRFLDRVYDGSVSEATVVQREGSYNIHAEIDGETYFVKSPLIFIEFSEDHDGKNIIQVMSSAGVEVEIVNDIINRFVLFSVVLLPLLLVSFIAVWFIALMTGRMNAWMEVQKGVKYSFQDVKGISEPKRELEEILDFLSGKATYQAVGARPPRGVLMSGPPGTGKTLMAKALAGEAKASFIAVSGSDFRSVWYGGSARRVRSMFEYARRNKPCVIFIDEFDAVGAKRSDSGNVADRESDATLNQLLAEMDGFSNNEGIVIVAATNLIDKLDAAVLRPGRFDRQVHLQLPTVNDREEILLHHIGSRSIASDVKFDAIAKTTPGFSGADLENLVNEAAVFAARDAVSTITYKHFSMARNKMVMGLKVSHVLSNDEMKRIAMHEAGHAIVSLFSELSDPIESVTIIPHGTSLGMVLRIPERDHKMIPLQKILDDITVLMGGRAAEELEYGRNMVSTGASSDIEVATRLARELVMDYGYSRSVGLVKVSKEREVHDRKIDIEVRYIIEDCYSEALKILKENRQLHKSIVAMLLEKETLSGQEVKNVLSNHMNK